MNDLQLRLREPEGLMVEQAADLTPEEKTTVLLRQLEAQKKQIETQIEAVKAEIKQGIENGLIYGSKEVGGTYEFQSRSTQSFDYKKAMMSGLFTLDQAEPFMSRKQSTALVFKPYKEDL